MRNELTERDWENAIQGLGKVDPKPYRVKSRFLTSRVILGADCIVCVYGAALMHGLRETSHFSFGLLAEI